MKRTRSLLQFHKIKRVLNFYGMVEVATPWRDAYVQYAVMRKYSTFLGRSALKKKLIIYVKKLGSLPYLDTMEITRRFKICLFPTI